MCEIKIKMKNKKYHAVETSKGRKRTKSISSTHKYMTAHYPVFGTGISIKKKGTNT
jgi:hypothetical protein